MTGVRNVDLVLLLLTFALLLKPLKVIVLLLFLSLFVVFGCLAAALLNLILPLNQFLLLLGLFQSRISFHLLSFFLSPCLYSILHSLSVDSLQLFSRFCLLIQIFVNANAGPHKVGSDKARSATDQ